MSISLVKIEQEAPELLSLAKTASDVVALRNLNGQKAKVALALDYSRSMTSSYKDGSMQRLAEKVLALSTQLDDDGAIDLFLFGTEAEYVGEVTLKNFRNVIDKVTEGRRKGTTNYTGLFQEVLRFYKLEPTPINESELGDPSKKVKPVYAPLTSPEKEPVLVVFLTDGRPDKRATATEEIRKASYSPVFWQFLSIGTESIPFLEKLDDEVKGRYIDNADYKPVGDVDRLNDSQLFNLLLDEYPSWIKEERNRGQIV